MPSPPIPRQLSAPALFPPDASAAPDPEPATPDLSEFGWESSRGGVMPPQSEVNLGINSTRDTPVSEEDSVAAGVGTAISGDSDCKLSSDLEVFTPTTASSLGPGRQHHLHGGCISLEVSPESNCALWPPWSEHSKAFALPEVTVPELIFHDPHSELEEETSQGTPPLTPMLGPDTSLPISGNMLPGEHPQNSTSIWGQSGMSSSQVVRVKRSLRTSYVERLEVGDQISDGSTGSDDPYYPMANPESGRLYNRYKALFALPFCGFYALMFMKISVMKAYYTDTPEIRASLGIIALSTVLGVLIDAFTDPFFANFSDNHRGRCGRRRPFILLGSMAGVGIFTLSYRPLVPSGVQASIWFGVFHVLVKLVDTVCLIPLEAWGAEMTPVYKERSNIWVLVEAMTVLGILFGAASPMVARAMPWSDTTSYPVVAFFASASFFIFCLGLFLFGKERDVALLRPPDRTRWTSDGVVPTLMSTWLSKPFTIVIVTNSVQAFGDRLPIAILPFMTRAVLGELCMPHKVSYFVLCLFYIFARSTSLSFWLWFTARFGKFNTLVVYHICLVTSSFVLGGITRDDETCRMLYFMMAGAAFWGFSVAGGNVLRSIISDIVDYDELLTGKRREGQYMMVAEFIPKFAQIPTEAFFFVALAYLGYERPGDWQCHRYLFGQNDQWCKDQPTVLFEELQMQRQFRFGGNDCSCSTSCCFRDDPLQPESVVWLLRLSFSAVPAIATLLSLSVLWWFPTEAKTQAGHEDVLRAVVKQKRGMTVDDPWYPGKELPPLPPTGEYEGLFSHLWPKEVYAVATGGVDQGEKTEPDYGVPTRGAMRSILLGSALILPGAIVVGIGWESLADDLGASVSPVGIVLVGVGILIIWFNTVRWKAAREIQRLRLGREHFIKYYNYLTRFTGAPYLDSDGLPINKE